LLATLVNAADVLTSCCRVKKTESKITATIAAAAMATVATKSPCSRLRAMMTLQFETIRIDMHGFRSSYVVL